MSDDCDRCFFLYHAMLADYMDTVFNYYSSNAEDNVSYKL